MKSPVVSALINAELAEERKRDAAIDALAFQLLGPAPATHHSRPADFIAWCDSNALPWLPARPSAVAVYILQHSDRNLDAIRDEVCNISAAHLAAGLADPAASWIVMQALSTVGKIDVPRSWSREEWPPFKALPFAVQAIIVRREKQRDAGIKQAQNEAADARKALAKVLAESPTSKEKANGNPENAAA